MKSWTMSCCLIEQHLSNGENFENATFIPLQALGPLDIEQCQNETKYLLNRNQIFIKRLSIAVTGLAASFVLINSVLFA